jgi:TonB family protein
MGPDEIGPGRFRPVPTQGPVYPPTLRARRVSGRVLVSFSVDTAGLIVRGSEVIEEESDQEFGNAVCAFLRRLHFTPLELSGKRYSVRILRQPFTFETH